MITLTCSVFMSSNNYFYNFVTYLKCLEIYQLNIIKIIKKDCKGEKNKKAIK